MIKKKYQIFLSSTFADLIEERKMAIDAIMQLKQIPAGMELFGAMGEEQLSYIKEIIRESDYYLLIIGGRYGSISDRGISYTEEEYDYACTLGLRIIVFIHENPEDRPAKFYEQDIDKRKKLEAFREKVKINRLVSFWKEPSDLRLGILSSLSNVINEFPAQGWSKEIKEENGLILFYNMEQYKEHIDVTYSYSDSSAAIVRSETSYVQLSARAGRIEDWMIDVCKEFIKLLNFNRRYLDDDEIVCLRRIWFNNVYIGISVSVDYLYNTPNPQKEEHEIAEMFYHDKELSEDIYVTVDVRLRKENFFADHFYENHSDYYKEY